MAPHNSDLLYEENEDVEVKHTNLVQKPRKYELVWKNILIFIFLHVSALYGLCLVFTSAKLLTTIQAFILLNVGTLGITCGTHRLWAHRSYKVNTPLKIILLTMQTIAFQNSVIEWVRDHRMHHKYVDTDGDPHNAQRGFFYAHAGWLLCKKHPDVKTKGKQLDISDLTSDRMLKFQQDHFYKLVLVVSFFLPIATPMYFWEESFKNAWHLNLLRHCLSLNVIWLVNSAAHLYGDRPYDRFINPRDNMLTVICSLGEGWHNFHHTFAWDYRTPEFGLFKIFNIGTAFIDFFGKIGWAYDFKTVPEDMIRRRILKTGDQTYNLRGWSDKIMLENNIRDEQILTKQ